MRLTHKKLCDLGGRWLKNNSPKKCPVVFIELVTTESEIPDIIGFNGGSSILIEAKTSRSDFKKDLKKPFRKDPSKGIGNYRLYICKEGLIKPEEIPDKWGLLYVGKYNKVTLVKSPFKGNIGRGEWFDVDLEKERTIMYSALRRIFSGEKVNKYFVK